ncbi:hypothetical protein [Urechidicola vernalis]|uniref:Uncharacterized protein n=1 Tax=Urechidicola vernalis TaxID=3075600 RepID=A0ABU2Y5B7_9FLAO|nr:hypothetical protein [Urechidicola sp. P050]MDT0553399.1 hypothetical protein [Urechidicola sp. P050]
MAKSKEKSPIVSSINNKQRLYLRYFTAILIDLTVLNLFDEYWDLVQINSFTISLFAAIMLQVLLVITLKIEHKIGDYFKKKEGFMAKFLRIFSAWAVLFGSKFVILEALSRAFGDEVQFKGPYHGIVAFIVVIVVMLLTEAVSTKITKALGFR